MFVVTEGLKSEGLSAFLSKVAFDEVCFLFNKNTFEKKRAKVVNYKWGSIVTLWIWYYETIKAIQQQNKQVE